MAAASLDFEMRSFFAGLKYVLVDVIKDYSIWKIRMKSDLQGHGLWLLVSGEATAAKAKRHKMQHLLSMQNTDSSIKKYFSHL